MKTLSLILLSVTLAVTASPLGNHAIFRRHNGAQPLARRYILESRMNIPPQCASLSGSVPSLVPTSTDASVTNLAIPSDLTLPSLFPTDITGAPDAVPTAGSLTSAILTGSRRSLIEFGLSEESTLEISSFVETWESLCLSSGGDIYTHDPCSRLAGFAGINALSEYANPCDQQHIADSMITFAKSKGIRNKDSLINFALKYRMHYRNSAEILGVIPSSFYCLKRPINPELVGVCNAQMSGANPGIFGSPNSPLAPFGSTGTCPLDMTPDMSTCSCVSSSSSGSSTSDGSSTGSTDTSTDSGATATNSSNITATATGSSDYTATATDSSASAATATDSSNSTATATATDSASLASTTDSSAMTATATDSASLASTTDSSAMTATVTDSASLASTTDSSAMTATATDSASLVSTTDSSAITATDSAASASATVAATKTFSTGINIQPTDISGDVNDPAGR